MPSCQFVMSLDILTYWCEDNLLWTSMHWWDHMMNISIAGEWVFMKDCWFDGHFAVICELHQRMTFFGRHVYGINFDWMLFKICFLYYSARSFEPNIAFTFWQDLVVFTRSAITPPKVNRFGWNLEHCENVVGGWPWKILGAIGAVATGGEAGEILFFLWVKRRTISPTSRRSTFTKFSTQHVNRCPHENFRNRILKISP